MHEPYLLETAQQSARYDLILYGHTHRVDYRRQGKMVIVNPGEVCGWLTGSPTCALVDLDPLRVEVLTVFGDPVALPS
jgi:putative phosphoesterase